MAAATACTTIGARASLNLATLEIDRWAGYIPADPQASARLETGAITISGHGLSLNAEVAPGGSIRAMMLDEQGGQVDGFGFENCLPITEGGPNCELRWRGRDLAELAGQTIRLAFEFQRAKLYAINAVADRACD